MLRPAWLGNISTPGLQSWVRPVTCHVARPGRVYYLSRHFRFDSLESLRSDLSSNKAHPAGCWKYNMIPVGIGHSMRADNPCHRLCVSNHGQNSVTVRKMDVVDCHSPGRTGLTRLFD